MSLLEIENASVYYEDFQALYDLNIKVEEGEIFACIGANGAGKSTMLKTVAGVLVPRRGRILFDGQPDRPHAHLQAGGDRHLLGAGRPPGVPQPHGAREPHDRGLPEPQGALDHRHHLRAVPAARSLSRSGRPPGSPAASSRRWPSAGRSWPTPASSSWTRSPWVWPRWSSSASTTLSPRCSPTVAPSSSSNRTCSTC